VRSAALPGAAGLLLPAAYAELVAVDFEGSLEEVVDGIPSFLSAMSWITR
jgi:hypothetical protein